MIVLGLSGGLGHDAAACIVKDGQLLAYSEDERFLRIKHAYHEPPVASVLHCLQETGISIDEIDAIALSWIPEKMQHWATLEKFKNHTAFRGKKLPPIVPVSHHLSHAAAAFYLSGQEEATILVMDGQGEDVSTTVAHAKNGEIKVLREYDVSQSIGYFYTVVNFYLNLGRAGEGKLMGLAPYGEAKYEFPIKLTSDGFEIDLTIDKKMDTHLQYPEVRRKWMTRLYRMFGFEQMPRMVLDPIKARLRTIKDFSQLEKDIAASAQQTLEDTILHLANVSVAQTGCRNLIISGGVGLNCTTNGKLERSGLFNEVFVLPATSDAGGCIGAAMEVGRSSGNNTYSRLKTPYWGPQFSDTQVNKIFRDIGIRATYYEDIASHAAKLITENRVIGWFQGRGEMGPRALGNRSIVANPTTMESFEKVNRQVKFREPWRPLAPSVLAEQANWLLEDARYSPYMLKAFQVRKEISAKVPAITHVDGSTRPQTVKAEDNALWHRLISEFYGHTGVPLVLNTSLNVDNEPICCSPVDALRTFYSCAMDDLIIGNFHISKR